jgi:hypothetical protein
MYCMYEGEESRPRGWWLRSCRARNKLKNASFSFCLSLSLSLSLSAGLIPRASQRIRVTFDILELCVVLVLCRQIPVLGLHLTAVSNTQH